MHLLQHSSVVSKDESHRELTNCVTVLSMSGMMSNAVGGPAAGVGGLSDISSLIEA